MLGHMFNIINGNAPTYLISGINMNQHRYSTRARELSCVIPRVKSSGLTSFMYQGVCHWNNLPLEINDFRATELILNTIIMPPQIVYKLYVAVLFIYTKKTQTLPTRTTRADCPDERETSDDSRSSTANQRNNNGRFRGHGQRPALRKPRRVAYY